MNAKRIVSGLMAVGAMAGALSATAQDDREAIAERLAPVGQLCMQGEECGSAAAPATAATAQSEGAIDGATIYNSICMACHETGAAGAPIRGDEDAWGPRTEQGFATLLEHSINGYNAMPARGGNPNLSDEEMRAAAAYMVEPVMDVPVADVPVADEPESTVDNAPADAPAASDDATDVTAADEPAAAQAAPAADDQPRDAVETSHAGLDGEALFTSSGCTACHSTGVAGAPALGDSEAWAPRIAQGDETLYHNAINGKGVMPPRGGSAASDDEIKAIVDYMVGEAQ